MTKSNLTIGIIGGLGWLGSAMTNAILSERSLSHCRLIISSRRNRPDDLPDQITYTQDNQWLTDESDIIVLSVRPQDWRDLHVYANGKTIVSVMAGITINDLQTQHKTDKVIRTLPNGAASIGQSYTPWMATDTIDASDLNFITDLLQAIGQEDQCSNEDEIDYLTAISGAGPAYPALLAQALEQSALQHGIAPNIARRAANSVVQGSSHLMTDLALDPQSMVSTFEEYQGTTAAGLKTMKQEGLLKVIDLGVKAAYKKSQTM